MGALAIVFVNPRIGNKDELVVPVVPLVEDLAFQIQGTIG